ncbi:YqaA family protein [Schauerella aestuarii]|uniref:YqaA family protein n=1 Tax=Schauerella aestuarii TaxID=2511204 RepID=UPI00136978E4|nr:YqaA family protein [Achromobacter aestuarii]MYZ43809.1 DedA family protein [Achromobacter aestuarii]
MEASLLAFIQSALAYLALPQVGLSAIFVIALVSATLLPLGSEPAVFAYIKVAPDMFWPAVLIATAGNTIGGVITYGMGWAAKRAADRIRHRDAAATHTGDASAASAAPAASAATAAQTAVAPGGRWHQRSHAWLDRAGPPALLLAWLPVIGDPLCAVAGWLQLRFWPSVIYMTIGKFGRYVVMTGGLLWLFPSA